MKHLWHKARENWHLWWSLRTAETLDRLSVLIWLVVATLIGLVGWLALKPFWLEWRQEKVLEQARHFTGVGDYRNALLSLQRATKLQPNSVEAWTEVSRLLAEVGSPQVVLAQENLVRLSPGDMALRYSLIEAAIDSGNLEAAERALGELSGQAAENPTFHRMAAAVAIAKGKTAEVEAHLAEVVAANPDDARARYDLYAIRLWGPDADALIEARTQLESLLTNPVTQVRAALQLLQDAGRLRNEDLLLRLVGLIISRLDPEVGKLPLIPEQVGEPRGWLTLIEVIKTKAVRSERDVMNVALWLRDIGLGREALVWLEGLPESTSSWRGVHSTKAVLAANIDDMERLANYLHDGAWGKLPLAVVQLTMASRWQSVRYTESHAAATWDDALAACFGQLDSLGACLRLSMLWHDVPKQERTLEVILERHPHEAWARDALRRSYLQRRDTTALWRLYRSWGRLEPGNKHALETWMFLSALLNQLPEEAERVLRENLRKHPGDPEATVALAAILWRKDQGEAGLEIMGQLAPREQFANPKVAFWLAILRQATGDTAGARRAAALVGQREFLPEERQLLRRLAAELGTTTTVP